MQCLHLDTPLLEQQNTKELYVFKNNRLHAQLGKLRTLRYKDTKKPNLERK